LCVAINVESLVIVNEHTPEPVFAIVILSVFYEQKFQQEASCIQFAGNAYRVGYHWDFAINSDAQIDAIDR